jgi:LAO/AO transport system kinase
VVINKADLDADAATRAQAQITSAMRLFGRHGHPVREPVHPGLVEGPAAASAAPRENWHPKVIQLSALLGQGVDSFWNAVSEFRALQAAGGQLAGRRRHQALAWMWERIEAGLKQDFRQHPAVRELLPGIAAEVEAGRLPASTAARNLLEARIRRT